MRRMGPQFRQLALLSLLGSGTLVCTLYMAYERYYEDVDHGAFVKSVKGPFPWTGIRMMGPELKKQRSAHIDKIKAFRKIIRQLFRQSNLKENHLEK